MKRSNKILNLGLGLSFGALMSVGLYQTMKPVDYKNVSDNKIFNLNTEQKTANAESTVLNKDYVTRYFTNRSIEDLEAESMISGTIKRTNNLADWADKNSVKLIYAIYPDLVKLNKIKISTGHDVRIQITGWGAIGGFARHYSSNQNKYLIYKNVDTKAEAKKKKQRYIRVVAPKKYKANANYSNTLDIYIVPKKNNYAVCTTKFTLGSDVADTVDRLNLLSKQPLYCNRTYTHTAFQDVVMASTLFGTSGGELVPEDTTFKLFLYQQTRANNNKSNTNYQKAGFTKLISNVEKVKTINYNNTDYLMGYIKITSGVRGTDNSSIVNDPQDTQALIGVNSGMVVRRAEAKPELILPNNISCNAHEYDCSYAVKIKGESRYFNRPDKGVDFYYKPVYKESSNPETLNVPGESAVTRMVTTVTAETEPLIASQHFNYYYRVYSTLNGQTGYSGNNTEWGKRYTLSSYIYYKGDMLRLRYIPYAKKYKAVAKTKILVYVNGSTTPIEYNNGETFLNDRYFSFGKKSSIKIASQKVPLELNITDFTDDDTGKSISGVAKLQKTKIKVNGKTVEKLITKQSKTVLKKNVNPKTGLYTKTFYFKYDLEDICKEGIDPECTTDNDENRLKGSIQYYLYKPSFTQGEKATTNTMVVNRLKYSTKDKKEVFGTTKVEPICDRNGRTGEWVKDKRYKDENTLYYSISDGGTTSDVKMTTTSDGTGKQVIKGNELGKRFDNKKMALDFINNKTLRYSLKFDYTKPEDDIVIPDLTKPCGVDSDGDVMYTKYDSTKPNWSAVKEYDAQEEYPLRFAFKTKYKRVNNMKDNKIEMRENVGKIKKVTGMEVKEVSFSPIKEFIIFPQRNPISFLTQVNMPVLNDRITYATELTRDNTKIDTYLPSDIFNEVAVSKMYYYSDKEKSMRFEVPDVDKNLKYKDVTSVDSSGKGTYVKNEDFENDGEFGAENSPRLSKLDYKIPLDYGKEVNITTKTHESRNIKQYNSQIGVYLDYLMIPNKYTGFVGYVKEAKKNSSNESLMKSEVKKQYEDNQKLLYKEFYLNPKNKSAVEKLKAEREKMYNNHVTSATKDGVAVSMIQPKSTDNLYQGLIGYKDEILLDKENEDTALEGRLIGYNSSYYMPVDFDTTMIANKNGSVDSEVETDEDSTSDGLEKTYTNYGGIGEIGTVDMYFVFTQKYNFDRYLLGSTLDDTWTAEQRDKPIAIDSNDYQKSIIITQDKGTEIKQNIANNDYRIPKLFGFRSSDGFTYYEVIKQKLGLQDD